MESEGKSPSSNGVILESRLAGPRCGDCTKGSIGDWQQAARGARGLAGIVADRWQISGRGRRSFRQSCGSFGAAVRHSQSIRFTQDASTASAQEALAAFGPRFEAAYLGGLRRKIGLTTEREGGTALVQDLLARMAENAADFTLTFRGLCAAAAGPEGDAAVRSLFADGGAYDAWAVGWRARLVAEPAPPAACTMAMREANPAVIPRNHNVEATITAALGGDFRPFEALLDATASPYEDRPGFEQYALPPAQVDPSYQTFCGT